MSDLPGDLLYTKEHEWLRREDDGTVSIGITDHAQSALGDLVYVELPEVGQDVESGGDMAVVESVKAASDVYSPIDGTIEIVSDVTLPSLKMVSFPAPTLMASEYAAELVPPSQAESPATATPADLSASASLFQKRRRERRTYQLERSSRNDSKCIVARSASYLSSSVRTDKAVSSKRSTIHWSSWAWALFSETAVWSVGCQLSNRA